MFQNKTQQEIQSVHCTQTVCRFNCHGHDESCPTRAVLFQIELAVIPVSKEDYSCH